MSLDDTLDHHAGSTMNRFQPSNIETPEAAAGSLRCQRCGGDFEPNGIQQATTRLCQRCGDPARWPTSAPARLHTSEPAQPRSFTPADKALIRSVHGYMPAPQLLDLLNQRLVADVGADATAYTLEQLHTEIGAHNAAQQRTGWSSVRKMLAEARRAGVLQHINEQVINDFAVVFSLNAKQVLHLKDVLLSSEGSR